jgi:uncharacterized protein YkwD
VPNPLHSAFRGRPAANEEKFDMQYRPLPLGLVVAVGALLGVPVAHADPENNNTLLPNNKRLNDSVVANVFTVQHQAGCTNDVRVSTQLQQAAQRHSRDVLNNRALDGDIGSDGSDPQQRAAAAGFRGPVAETVAINQSIAISGNDLINRWYYNPAYFNIMSNCANSQMGVWTENSPDRTVVVAVYGQPQGTPGHPPPSTEGENIPLDATAPDYDASDELQFGLNWFPWILRGVYPPPANPPG